MLIENHLTQKVIRLPTTEKNGIVEKANKTMKESLVTVILTDNEQVRHELFKIVEYYNNRGGNSSLNYLTPIQYYKGNPEEVLRIMESKIERARILRREMNMKERKGGETAGQELSLNYFPNLSRVVKNSTTISFVVCESLIQTMLGSLLLMPI